MDKELIDIEYRRRVVKSFVEAGVRPAPEHVLVLLEDIATLQARVEKLEAEVMKYA